MGRGHVRIRCKGAPSRDRRREEARNINDSLPALRRDRGLCNRFGQPAPPRSPGGAPRVRRRPRRALPDVERCISHSRVQFQPLFSRAKCTSRVRSARFGVGRRASRPTSTSLNPRARHYNPRARTSSRRARGLSDDLVIGPTPTRRSAPAPQPHSPVELPDARPPRPARSRKGILSPFRRGDRPCTIRLFSFPTGKAPSCAAPSSIRRFRSSRPPSAGSSSPRKCSGWSWAPR